MKQQSLTLTNEKRPVPVLLWGEEDCSRLFVAVHGKGGHKQDAAITAFARQAVAAGCSVLSFDLPDHGERQDSKRGTLPQAVSDLEAVCQFARTLAENVGVFALGYGAYLTMAAYARLPINWLMLAAPEVDMVRILRSMLQRAGATPAQLEKEGSVWTDTGWEVNWNHYSYAMENPVIYDACCPMDVLYGRRDELVLPEEVERFVACHHGRLTVSDEAGHRFEDEASLSALENWAAAYFAEYNRVETLVATLTDRERNTARLKLLEMSRLSNRIYAWLAEFLKLLDHPNSRVRSCALQLIAANARWDEQQLLDKELDRYLRHLQDEKALTVRECIAGIPVIAAAKPRLRPRLLKALEAVQPGNYADSMAPLLEKDVAEVSAQLRQ